MEIYIYIYIYKKYFPNSARRQKVGKFVRLEQGDLTVAQYEAKFIELSRFAPQLIAIDRGGKSIKVSGWTKALSEE